MTNKTLVIDPITTLKPYRRNARSHSKAQVEQIAKSIKTFGFTNPVLIDKTGTIIAGHGRVEAAKSLGMTHVPTLTLHDLSKEKIRAYIIADNKLAENVGWDTELLALEIKELDILELDFDLTVIGFETPELDLLLGNSGEESQHELDTLTERVIGPPVTLQTAPSTTSAWIGVIFKVCWPLLLHTTPN